MESLKDINRFHRLDTPRIFDELELKLSEALLSITQFIHGCRVEFSFNCFSFYL